MAIFPPPRCDVWRHRLLPPQPPLAHYPSEPYISNPALLPSGLPIEVRSSELLRRVPVQGHSEPYHALHEVGHINPLRGAQPENPIQGMAVLFKPLSRNSRSRCPKSITASPSSKATSSSTLHKLQDDPTTRPNQAQKMAAFATISQCSSPIRLLQKIRDRNPQNSDSETRIGHPIGKRDSTNYLLCTHPIHSQLLFRTTPSQKRASRR